MDLCFSRSIIYTPASFASKNNIVRLLITRQNNKIHTYIRFRVSIFFRYIYNFIGKIIYRFRSPIATNTTIDPWAGMSYIFSSHSYALFCSVMESSKNFMQILFPTNFSFPFFFLFLSFLFFFRKIEPLRPMHQHSDIEQWSSLSLHCTRIREAEFLKRFPPRLVSFWSVLRCIGNIVFSISEYIHNFSFGFDIGRMRFTFFRSSFWKMTRLI